MRDWEQGITVEVLGMRVVGCGFRSKLLIFCFKRAQTCRVSELEQLVWSAVQNR